MKFQEKKKCMFCREGKRNAAISLYLTKRMREMKERMGRNSRKKIEKEGIWGGGRPGRRKERQAQIKCSSESGHSSRADTLCFYASNLLVL